MRAAPNCAAARAAAIARTRAGRRCRPASPATSPPPDNRRARARAALRARPGCRHPASYPAPVAGAGVRGAVRHPPRKRVGCLRPSCRSLRGTSLLKFTPILAHDGRKYQAIVSYPAEKYCNSLNSGAWAAWGGNSAGRAKFAGLTANSGDSWGEENLNAVKRSTSQWVRTAQRPLPRACRHPGLPARPRPQAHGRLGAHGLHSGAAREHARAGRRRRVRAEAEPAGVGGDRRLEEPEDLDSTFRSRSRPCTG